MQTGVFTHISMRPFMVWERVRVGRERRGQSWDRLAASERAGVGSVSCAPGTILTLSMDLHIPHITALSTGYFITRPFCR